MRKTGATLEGDFLTEGMRLLAQMLMDLEVTERMGAAKHERAPARTNQRNGYSKREWDTRVVRQRCPTLRAGQREYITCESRKIVISTYNPDESVIDLRKHIGIYITS